MPAKPNYRLIEAGEPMPDHSRAMLKRSTPPDPLGATNQFDVALASIKKGQHPIWTYLYMRKEGLPWGRIGAASLAIGTAIKTLFF